MKLRKLFAAAVSTVFLLSCSPEEKQDSCTDGKAAQPVTSFIQDKEHFSIESGEEYIPLNYDNQIGMWFPYMYYAEYMQGKTEEEFRSEVRSRFKAAKEQSVNTVYVHIRPCGDSYYSSSSFPCGAYLDGDYDVLSIMLEEGHALGLSVHGWINPLRCQTVEEMKSLPDDYIVKQWSENCKGTFVSEVNGRYYLNPAYDEVIQLICSDVDEIVRNYDVDGIHIDDYFYPTTDEAFDREAFEASGHRDLSQWRLENCSRLVHGIFESVKRIDSNVLFGISPQGNINANYSSQYADVKQWGGSVGYCDYIVPQIYFGFENETCPFAETLNAWENLVTAESVSLVIGLAAYKLGAEDKWAGAAGEREWIENPDIIQQQISLVEESDVACGYALYY